MSLLAGILSKEGDSELPSQLVQALKDAMSRVTGHALDVYRGRDVCLLKLDVGTYGDRAFCIDSNGSVAMMAGDPVLRINGQSTSPKRTAALERLLIATERDENENLCLSTGQYSLALYTPRTRTLKLVSDKLGLRPIYYWDGPSFFIFASALRILEAIPVVPRAVDLRAVTEILNFGYALGSRTPYADVQALRPAEILTVTDRSVSRKQYWRLDEAKATGASVDNAIDELHHRFTSAVKLRVRDEQTTVALLSGGLDSRCVVAALRAENTDVHTLNCSFPGTQDKVFAAAFSNRIGSIHHELNDEVGDPKIFRILSDMLASARHQPLPERRFLLWAGNDGSVSLGHLFLPPESIGLLRQDKLDLAIDAFLSHRQFDVITRLFRGELARQLSPVLHEGLRQELLELHCEDPARNLWVFLTLTNVRKHFRNLLEDIDHHKLEFQLPFLDTDFLSAIAGLPIERCLRHELYVRWLDRFGPSVTSVPWQAYEGHHPCPIPVPEGLRNQWDRSRQKRQTERRESRFELIRQSREMLRSDFLTSIFDRRYLKFAHIAYLANLHDYGYLLKTALEYWKYVARAGGAVRLPP